MRMDVCMGGWVWQLEIFLGMEFQLSFDFLLKQITWNYVYLQQPLDMGAYNNTVLRLGDWRAIGWHEKGEERWWIVYVLNASNWTLCLYSRQLIPLKAQGNETDSTSSHVILERKESMWTRITTPWLQSPPKKSTARAERMYPCQVTSTVLDIVNNYLHMQHV